ncbi:phosphoribosylaminoimidazolesuccinocarboxamide synthase [bacterium]|nr:phosphoribosylaminoimidazolesuccinocarboxamide synthase [bacterium]MCI0604340.1 phosphoribosylaminoimidazolesuccinocarboxamide synthase [bacterium]
MSTVVETSISEYPLKGRGKVRDIYDLDDSLLFIASDRISAFDYVLPNPIPDKGKVLTQISLFWFHYLNEIVNNHVITADFKEFPERLQKYPELQGRAMIVKKAKMFPVECVARGYLSGSGWKEYRETGAVCGIRLPAGLRESDALPEPIFTPATKAETGHDINIGFEQVVSILDEKQAHALRDLTLHIYKRASDHALQQGIIIADTKFEFGIYEGKIILCDEVLTPDSSRFWPKDDYQPGRGQKSLDKQYVRDYLEKIRWNKQPPCPDLPPEVIQETSRKYREIYRRITGQELP